LSQAIGINIEDHLGECRGDQNQGKDRDQGGIDPLEQVFALFLSCDQEIEQDQQHGIDTADPAELKEPLACIFRVGQLFG
jgi:hypothetical protein